MCSQPVRGEGRLHAQSTLFRCLLEEGYAVDGASLAVMVACALALWFLDAHTDGLARVTVLQFHFYNPKEDGWFPLRFLKILKDNNARDSLALFPNPEHPPSCPQPQPQAASTSESP